MRAVDTNVLVRLIARDNDQELGSCLAYIRDGAWVSTVVLAETLWVLGSIYKIDANRMIAIVQQLLSQELLVLQEPAIVAAALEQFRRRPSLGFSDCLILELARKAGHPPLGTFDRNLSKLPGAERIGPASPRRAR